MSLSNEVPGTVDLLPDFVTPAELAQHFGVSERTIRACLREYGTYSKLSRKIVVFPEQIEQLKEAMRCHSSYNSAASTGTTRARSPVGDYAALQKQRTKRSQKGSKQRKRLRLGNSTKMGQ